MLSAGALTQYLITPDRVIRYIDGPDALAAYVTECGFEEIHTNLRQLLGYNSVGSAANPRKDRGKASMHELMPTISWLVHDKNSETMALLGDRSGKWNTFTGWDGDGANPNKRPASFDKLLVLGPRRYDGWRLVKSGSDEEASLHAHLLSLGDRASLVGLAYTPHVDTLTDFLASIPPPPPPAPLPQLPPPPLVGTPPPPPKPPLPRQAASSAPPLQPLPSRPPSTRAKRHTALPALLAPPVLSPPIPARVRGPARMPGPYRPHFHSPEAQALVYLLQHNPAEAKKYCPDISPIDGNTGPDKILLSMFRKLGGQVTRVRLEPAGSSTSASGAHKEHAASCYELGRKMGRPCKEAALSEAAAKLVGQKWRAYKQQQAHKQRDPKVVKAARASRTKAKFTSRGNAITCAKPAAIVQTAHFCSLTSAKMSAGSRRTY